MRDNVSGRGWPSSAPARVRPAVPTLRRSGMPSAAPFLRPRSRPLRTHPLGPATARPPSKRLEVQRISFTRGATARQVTTSNRLGTSSARARATLTRSDRPNSSTANSRKWLRLSSGSTRHTCRSGLAMAMGNPGRPAPLPTSATDTPWGNTSSRASEFPMCRCHTRSPSRGPSSPHSIPRPSNTSTYCFNPSEAWGKASTMMPSASSVTTCAPPRAGSAARPPTRRPTRRRQPRHGRSCARRRSRAPA